MKTVGSRHDRLAPLPQVAGENDPQRAIPAGYAQLDHCRAQDVPGVVKNGVDMVAQSHRPAIGSGRQQGQRAFHILQCVEWLNWLGIAAPFAAMAFFLERGVFGLNLGRVP